MRITDPIHASRPRRLRATDAGTADRTPTRLLDAAEVLFLSSGFDGATLRMVTAQAGANLAAANYHFGGKEGLFLAMLARRLDPLHEARIDLLEAQLKARRARPVRCESLIAALCLPALELAREPARGGPDFLRLLGRAYIDPSPVVRAFLADRYAPAAARFKAAFSRALPRLAPRELSWRLHFVLGALSYTLAGADAWRLIASIQGEGEDDAQMLDRLAPFLVAGLRAPVAASPALRAGTWLQRARALPHAQRATPLAPARPRARTRSAGTSSNRAA